VGGGKEQQLKVERGKWRGTQKNKEKEGDKGRGRRQTA